jgi:hypothetical protein
MKTGVPTCERCGGVKDVCKACGGRQGGVLYGTAALRGALWAEHVVKQLVERWPLRWPRSPKAVYKAGERIKDIAGSDPELYGYLLDVCMKAAAKRYGEMLDYLRGARQRLPPRPQPIEAKDEDTPL